MSADANGRDRKGRFRKGFSGNPAGRPSRPVELEYLRVVLNACSLERWREAVEKRIQKAIEGDSVAFDWLEGYVIGKSRLSLAEVAMREQLGVTAEAEFLFKFEKAIDEGDVKSEAEKMAEMVAKLNGTWHEKPYLLELAEYAKETGRKDGQ